MRNLRLPAAIALVACLAVGPAVAGDTGRPAPTRIVSLNLCADELVLRLADRAQIAAVTYFAHDPRGSTVASEAASIPVTRGLSEEIIALKPDLVIAGAFTTRATVGMLKRIGLPLLELGVPSDFAGVRDQIRAVAAAVGHPERGKAMIAAFDARLAAVDMPGVGHRLRALVMRPNGFTVAPGTLGDAILRAAGLVNVAAEIGQDRSGQVPLEAAALSDADLIVLDEGPNRTPSLADTVLHHPVLGAFRREGRTVSIPNRLWSCPGPQVAEVVERLAAAARARAARQTLSPPRERVLAERAGEGPDPNVSDAALASPEPRSRDGHPIVRRLAGSDMSLVDGARSAAWRSPPPCGEEVGGGGGSGGTAALDPGPPPPPDPSPQGGGEMRWSFERLKRNGPFREPAGLENKLSLAPRSAERGEP